MKIAAYQFAVSSGIEENLRVMEKAIAEARARQIDLLFFPECALTGYPPRDLPSSSAVDFALVAESCARLRRLSDESGLAFVVGTVAEEAGQIYNRALFLAPGAELRRYDKRALWGWDRENFVPGNRPGIVEYKGFRIGLRICFEVRFPEYFRELYREGTDLNAVLFYDVSDREDPDRYSLIKGHLQTRAVENVCPILSVNATRPFQTAPTAIIGRSGQILAECPRGREGLVEYELEKRACDFGESGWKELSDALTGV